VKPVLVAILNEQFLPAANRHRKFMQGGAARAKLDRDAGHKGYMTEQEVSRLTKMLTHWVLREKAKAELIHVDIQVILLLLFSQTSLIFNFSSLFLVRTTNQSLKGF
jgi:hypothetical protein